jgi:hypothetical protein
VFQLKRHPLMSLNVLLRWLTDPVIHLPILLLLHLLILVNVHVLVDLLVLLHLFLTVLLLHLLLVVLLHHLLDWGRTRWPSTPPMP